MNMRDNEQVRTGVAEKAGKHENSNANGTQFRPTKTVELRAGVLRALRLRLRWVKGTRNGSSDNCQPITP
jgi:hypothetical protein